MHIHCIGTYNSIALTHRFEEFDEYFFRFGLNPFPKQQILDPLKLKEFADDNFEFDENGRKFSKWLENTVGKGKIALMSNFSFCHCVFKRLVLQMEWVKYL